MKDNEKKQIFLYGNGCFLNKGCEAITRGTVQIINSSINNSEFISVSDNPEYDKKMQIKEINSYINLLDGYNVVLRMLNKLTKNNYLLTKLKIKNANKSVERSSICISLGGDNYCYKKNYYLMKQNKELHEKFGKKTVLWGCSISDSNIDKEIEEDLRRYNLITVRESLTEENLKKKGISKNVKLVSDPAFIMEKKKVNLPKQWEEGNTIGLNLSPMILSNGKDKEQTYNSFIEFIEYLIENTTYKIALIPHVFFANNNDYILLKRIYNQINNNRLILIGDNYTAEELKYIISNCELFIGGRTHATIAAYSTNVPTLVIGYSVKAKGIAKDIFGTYENYVIPVQELENKEQLIDAYNFLETNKQKIKEHLEKNMPQYKMKALKAGEYLKELLEG